jgi:ABC-type polysaccharide/polyol phosphate transport system ATPase subunit
MHEVYIPLKVKGTKEYERIDAYQAITEHQRLMVVGEPGAGKSTLLKHIALSYAEGNLMRLPNSRWLFWWKLGICGKMKTKMLSSRLISFEIKVSPKSVTIRYVLK